MCERYETATQVGPNTKRKYDAWGLGLVTQVVGTEKMFMFNFGLCNQYD